MIFKVLNDLNAIHVYLFTIFSPYIYKKDKIRKIKLNLVVSENYIDNLFNSQCNDINRRIFPQLGCHYTSPHNGITTTHPQMLF